MKIIIPIALCIFLSCQSTQRTSDKPSDDAIQLIQKEFTSNSANECVSWEEIIKKAEYQKLPEDLRQEIRNKYFDTCLSKKFEEKYYFKEYHKFFINALETEKRAGLGNYLNCISGDCINGTGTLEYYKGAMRPIFPFAMKKLYKE